MAITVNFTDASQPGPSGPITAWSWDFGDSNTSTSQNPSHAYAAAGSYSVTLTVTGSGSDGTATATIPVVVVDSTALNSSFTYSSSGLAVTFTDTSTAGPSGPITGWSWDFGDSNTSTSENPSHTYAAGGAYTVTLTVTGTSPDGTATSSLPVSVSSGGGSSQIWKWDVQSLAKDPNSDALVSSMLATTPAGYCSAMEALAHRTSGTSVYERHGTSIDGFDANFWIPDGSLPGLSQDHHFAVLDDVTGRTTDMWKATLGTDGKIDTWKGGRTYPTSPVVAYLPQMVKSGANTTTNASNVPALPSMLTPADVAAGIASHTLAFTVYHPGPGVKTSSTRGNRYPAAPYATPWPGITANPPLGTMIRLPKSATLASGAGPLETCIFNTLKVYGAVLRDNGPDLTFKAIDAGGGGQGKAAWAAVGVNLNTSAGGVLNDIGHSDKMTRIPWHLLEITVPPAP